jgi:hypothetical protein
MMSAEKKALLGGAAIVFAGAAAAAAILFLTVWGFSSALGCKSNVHEQSRSPDGALVAVLFEMACGATTDFNTQVAVLLKNEAGLPDQRSTFLVLGGREQVSLQWLNRQELVVRMRKGVNVFKQEQPNYGVTVRYE